MQPLVDSAYLFIPIILFLHQDIFHEGCKNIFTKLKLYSISTMSHFLVIKLLMSFYTNTTMLI